MAEIIKHPSYSSTLFGPDFALLRLESVPGCDAQIAKPLLGATTPLEGDNLVTAGWGALYADGSDGNPDPLPSSRYADRLYEVTLQVSNEQRCKSYLFSDSQFSSMFCAGLDGGGKAPCFGDSGGPLFEWSGDVATLFGVVSWGSNLCGDSSPGFSVFSRVSYVESWIAETTAQPLPPSPPSSPALSPAPPPPSPPRSYPLPPPSPPPSSPPPLSPPPPSAPPPSPPPPSQPPASPLAVKTLNTAEDTGGAGRRSRVLLSAQSMANTPASAIFDAFADADSVAVFLVDVVRGTGLDAAILLAQCAAAGHTCSAEDPTSTYVALAGEVL